MGQNVSVRTIASASQIADRAGIEPTESRAVIGSGFFAHVFHDVESDDPVGHILRVLAPLGALVPAHAVEIEIEPALLTA